MALHSRRYMGKDDSVAYCPQCTKAVPKWAETCQFCGSPVHVRKAHSGDVKTRRGGLKIRVSTRTWVAYYLSAALFVLGGVYEAAAVTYGMGRVDPAAQSIPFAMILGAITSMFGIAVFFDSPAIRRSASAAAAIRMLLSLFLVGAFLFGMMTLGTSLVYFFILQSGFFVASLMMAWAGTYIGGQDNKT